MIIYENSLLDFKNDVLSNRIVDSILKNFNNKGFNLKSNKSEINSWKNSLMYMNNIFNINNFPNDVYIAIEYKIPQSSKRIDFMIFGHDENDNKNFILVELKQWEKAEDSHKQDIVLTYVGNKKRDVLHPSYQCKSYLYSLEMFNEYVHTRKAYGKSLAYLHNARKIENENLLNDKLYTTIIESPIYFSEDSHKLSNDIYSLVNKGKGKEILWNIENSKMVPSKKLIDSLNSVLNDPNNRDYMLLEAQKEVFENIIEKHNETNNVFIINGNPGTGKSVVAINLLRELINKKKTAIYVTPNAAFRECLTSSIKSNKSNELFKSIFVGSSSFYNCEKNKYDWIIVDEAHRLKNKAYMYKGKNQIEDIIKSSKNTIFFVDENQVIRDNDIGTNENINEVALAFNKKIYSGDKYTLDIQFRCSGSSGYINSIDNALQIRETANFYIDDNDSYEFKLVDNPHKINELIDEKISKGFTNSKIVAGYAWKWKTKDLNRDQLALGNQYDIYIEEHNYKGYWNFAKDLKWAKTDFMNKEIGCVHTCQGLEFDYCGVIIGPDIKIDDDNNIFCDYDNYFDAMGKQGLKNNRRKLDALIKNVYKILLTRGQLGTFVYICDEKLRKYFKKHLKESA